MNEKKQCFDFDNSFIEPNWDLRNCFVEKNKTSTSFCELLQKNNWCLTLAMLSVLLFQHNENLIKEKNNLQNRIDKAIEFIEKNSKQCLTNKIDEKPTKVIGKFMWHIDDLLDILKESGE